MMIDKRLIRTVRESKKYIAWNVIYQWISLVANITMMVSIADLLSRLFANTADRENFVCTVIVVAAAVGIRYYCSWICQCSGCGRASCLCTADTGCDSCSTDMGKKTVVKILGTVHRAWRHFP